MGPWEGNRRFPSHDMHSLIITAHPSSTGFTHRIARTYADARTAAGHTAEILNLYAPENREEFLSFESERDLKKDQRDPYQQRIAAADEIVFVFPIWWYAEPAILKNFLDRHFTAGFAYQFTKTGLKGLLKGKTARFFSTSGGPAWVYQWHLFPYASSFRRSIKGCGIRIASKTIFGPRRRNDPALEEKWLAEVRALAA